MMAANPVTYENCMFQLPERFGLHFFLQALFRWVKLIEYR